LPSFTPSSSSLFPSSSTSDHIWHAPLPPSSLSSSSSLAGDDFFALLDTPSLEDVGVDVGALFPEQAERRRALEARERAAAWTRWEAEKGVRACACVCGRAVWREGGEGGVAC
jgi:hypothetical protein